MTVLLYTHPACLAHDPGPGHPESPARLRAVLEALDADRFAVLDRFEAPRAQRTRDYVADRAALIEEVFETAPGEGEVRLDPDTAMSPGSLDAALRAAGAVTAAVDGVVAGHYTRAFCAVRPPGHHATRGEVMGFCFFNNVAVGIRHALEVHHLARVTLIDFDVHHGNGTQDIFYNDPTVFYGSTHQMPLFPGSGSKNERGAGNICNAPLAARTGTDEMQAAYTEMVLPALEAFKPDFLFISAGFDADYRDPLAQLNWRPEDFAWLTLKLREIADRTCGGRIVSILEGGYDRQGLATGVAAHVTALMS